MLCTECNIENDELYNAVKRSKHLLQYFTYNTLKHQIWSENKSHHSVCTDNTTDKRI